MSGFDPARFRAFLVHLSIGFFAVAGCWIFLDGMANLDEFMMAHKSVPHLVAGMGRYYLTRMGRGDLPWFFVALAAIYAGVRQSCMKRTAQSPA